MSAILSRSPDRVNFKRKSLRPIGGTLPQERCLQSPRKRRYFLRERNALARFMDLDDLLQRYFGTSDLSEVSQAVQMAGLDRLLVDFGLETDRARRFALWSVLYMLGNAPDLDVAFKEEADREAARNLMDLFSAAGED